ncbi:MAG: aminotransferase class V-fold PLP-dependent enzyme [Oscillospiraceae bacterium]|nr:aminotransferase class V-fold PLP-dependent enzyme [Oscillospiraceae bacterium]
MIYLDNGATTYPKPKSVIASVTRAMTEFGANAGRGAYKMAVDTTEQIYLCRKTVADFFGCPSSENIIFTYNCTMALNIAIKGLAVRGAHFVISDLEHNAVLRPLEKLSADGVCSYSIAKVEYDEQKTLENFENALRSNTVAIICTGASNVFGIIPPLKALSRLAHKNGSLFIVDSAQTAGVLPINMTDDGIDILCCAGHKGLMGPTGTGILIFACDIPLNTIIEGGTGSNSALAVQPSVLPDRFESGTPNIPGIIGLHRGIEFVNEAGAKNICRHEIKLIKYLQRNLENSRRIKLYTDFFDSSQNLAPILSFNIDGMHSEQTAAILAESGIAVRAGLHCAPLAHRKMNTEDTGTVRICPSFFTKKSDIDFVIKSIRKIAN